MAKDSRVLKGTQITRDHVLEVLKAIDAGQIAVPSRNESVDYDLVEKGILYPPKFVVAVARNYAKTNRIEENVKSDDFITTDAKRVLSGLGFDVKGKEDNDMGESTSIFKVNMQDVVPEETRNDFISKKLIALPLENDNKKHDGDIVDFKSMKIGDRFYLCNGTKLLLLGIVQSGCKEEAYDNKSYYVRSFSIWKLLEKPMDFNHPEFNKSKTDSPYWPGTNHRCKKLEDSNRNKRFNIKEFEQFLLKPCFKTTLYHLVTYDSFDISFEDYCKKNGVKVDSFPSYVSVVKSIEAEYGFELPTTAKVDMPFFDSPRCREIMEELRRKGDSKGASYLKKYIEYRDYLNKLKNLDSNNSITDEPLDTEKVSDDNPKTLANDFSKNIILYGPPGTGKTYNSIFYAVAICDNVDPEDFIKRNINNYTGVKEKYDALLKESKRIEFVTFHQSYGYEEFIEGIRPALVNDDDLSIDDELSENSKELKYHIKPGAFKEFCNTASKDQENNYVFIIDEINRGNISKIFGELITLIEESKRKGSKESMSVVLPYSNKPFSVPNNVYIVGTMNTADRSIAMMDTALRRRFHFVEMMPKPDLAELKKISINGINISSMLTKINERIELLFDREHQIGHSFFLKLKDGDPIEKLGSIFKNEIIPLLQEYFYDDYNKIRLVLGDNAKGDDNTCFIKKVSKKRNDVFAGDDKLEDVNIPDVIYSINSEAFDNPDSYKHIQ